MKAIASGNPAVLTLAEADAELQRLSILHKNHADEQFLARRSLRQLPETIGRMSDRLTTLSADLATVTDHAADSTIIGRRTAARDEAAGVLGHYLESVPTKVPQPSRVPLGAYRGLRFGLLLHPQFSPEVYLQGSTTLQDTLSRDHHGPRAILNAVERLAASYRPQCNLLRKDLEIAEAQLRDYKARLGAAFAHEEYFSKLTALRDQLKAGLSLPPSGGEAESPSVADLAASIKALEAAHTIEATPERIGKHRTVAAEKPVTARIRRRNPTIAAVVPASSNATSATPPTAPRAAEPVVLSGHFTRKALTERQAEREGRIKQLSLW